MAEFPKDILERAGSFSAELAVAAKLAHAAGTVALRYHGKDLEVERKDHNEPVTIADRECSALIVEGLEQAFPADVIISEELPDDSRRLGSGRVWYVDPIDGTKNFVRGASSYCIMIGLAIAHEPVFGVVYQPNHECLVFGSKGAGSFSHYGNRTHRLATSGCDEPGHARLLSLSSNPPADRLAVQTYFGLPVSEVIGSIGLKLCAIALGASDLYVNPATRCSSWDTCAPQIILQEAGGQITDMHGHALRYNDAKVLRHGRGLVASNGPLHTAALARLGALFPATP